MNNATTSTSTPALFAVLYSITNESQASLYLRGLAEPQQEVTVIHESNYGVKDHSMTGDGVLLSISVSQGDALMLLVRDRGTIVACGLFEVNLELSEIYGAILAPKASANLLIDQCDSGIVERGNLRSLAALFVPETAMVR